MAPERNERNQMKIGIVRTAFAVSALLLFGVVVAFAEPKGDTVKVKGEVVDLWCYLEGGDHGADHKECAVSFAKAGNPIGLVTEKGDIYVMMGIKDHQPDKYILIDKLPETVPLQITLINK